MASHYKVEVGQAIRRRREELGLTQKDLADATHYKEAQTVSRWERGENLPGDLENVARALQWTLAEMVAGIEPPNRRVARQFGQVADNGRQRSQLDRIEAMVEEIYFRVTGERYAATTAEVVGQLPDRLEETDESLSKKAPAQPAIRRAATTSRRA